MSTATTAPETSESTATVTADATNTATSATDEKGQATTSSTSQTATAATTQTEETFFDPNAIPDDLKPAYKQMQAAFTKKMQHISKQKDKIAAYENFEKDPIGNMQSMAQKMGYSLTRAEAAAQLNAQKTGTATDFQPQSWNEVAEWMKSQIMPQIQQQFAPFVEKVQQVTAHNIEQQLDSIDSNWRMYEDEMKSMITEHPTLVKDVAKLYRLSVPEEVWTSRATAAALRKLENKGQAAAVHSRSTTKTAPAPKRATSFQDAIDIAREKVNQK